MSCAHVHVQPSLGPGRLMATVENKKKGGEGGESGNDIFFAPCRENANCGNERLRNHGQLSSLFYPPPPPSSLPPDCSRIVRGRIDFSDDLISRIRKIVIINNGIVRPNRLSTHREIGWFILSNDQTFHASSAGAGEINEEL